MLVFKDTDPRVQSFGIVMRLKDRFKHRVNDRCKQIFVYRVSCYLSKYQYLFSRHFGLLEDR